MTSYHVSISTIDAYGHKTSPVILEWEAHGFTKMRMRTIWDHLQICTDGSNGSVTTALMSVDGQTVRAFRLRITGDRDSAKQYYELSTMNLRPEAYFGPEIIREGVWSE